MKKIILTFALAICLTGCGNEVINDEIREVKIQDEKTDGNLLLEENYISDEESETNENDEGKTEIDTNEKGEEEVSEKSILSKTEDYVENVVTVPECDEDTEEPRESTDKEIQVYEEGVEVGKKAVDFEVELLSGKKVKLSDYSGTPVFLNFWATWCGPCVGEMPDIEKIKNEYGDKLAVLAINGGELKEDVKSFIDRKGYTFNVGVDEKGTVLGLYDSMYIPLSVFIDENGIIRERQVGALSESRMREIVGSLVNGL